jgi:hypothetical protein
MATDEVIFPALTHVVGVARRLFYEENGDPDPGDALIRWARDYYDTAERLGSDGFVAAVESAYRMGGRAAVKELVLEWRDQRNRERRTA